MNNDQQAVLAYYYSWVPFQMLANDVQIAVLELVRRMPEITMADINLQNGTVRAYGRTYRIPQAAYLWTKNFIDNP